MMMPANFSAVSENEMTYVMGGSIADYLAPVMGKDQWSNFSKNLVTIIGNHYVASFLGNTVGKVVTGTYVPGQILDAFGTKFSGIWNHFYPVAEGNVKPTAQDKVLGGALGALNIGLNIVGNLAAIYNLGFGIVDNGAKIIGITAF